jgi:hypothetical protein
MRKEEKKTSRCHEHSAAPRSTSPSNIQGKAAAILARTRTFNDRNCHQNDRDFNVEGGALIIKMAAPGVKTFCNPVLKTCSG